MITFSIGAGQMVSSSGTILGPAYAGAPGHVNNPDDCGLKGLGPLPKGRYIIGAPVTDPVTGIFSLPLTPDPSNEMFDRGSFFIHGANAVVDVDGQQASSHGCPVASHPVREAIWTEAEATDHLLEVIS